MIYLFQWVLHEVSFLNSHLNDLLPVKALLHQDLGGHSSNDNVLISKHQRIVSVGPVMSETVDLDNNDFCHLFYCFMLKTQNECPAKHNWSGQQSVHQSKSQFFLRCSVFTGQSTFNIREQFKENPTHT